METAAADDRTLVAAMRRGDRAGLEGLYRGYADRLYTYARALLREPEAAADAVHDAFLTASQRIDQLRDPDRLRPWLYAIVRTECLRQLRQRSRSRPLEEAVEPVAETADPATGVNAEQVRDLVHTATAALNPGDREVVHLALRHELSAVDIGAALGVPANHAHARLSRARSQLERALGALLVARSGTRDCQLLADLLDGWRGRLTPTLRKRVSRHIDGCARCGLLRREQLNPSTLLSAYTAPGFLVVAATVWPKLSSAEPTGPTGRTETTEPTEPPTPIEPTEPGGTTRAAEPGGTTEPGEPIETAEPGAGTAEESGARSGGGPAPGLSAGSTAGAAVAVGTAAPPAVARSGRPAPGLRNGDRRRRRLARTAGLLVLLAVGVWTFGPEKPASQDMTTTAGAPAGRSGTPSGPPPAPSVSGAATVAAGEPLSAAGPDSTGLADVTPGTPQGRTGDTGPAAGPADPAAAPTRPPAAPEPAAPRPASPRPTAPRPTGAPQLVVPFTVTASGHVRCGQQTYSLVVRATGSTAIETAQVRWTPDGDATSSAAMTVDGSTASVTVGRLRASSLTWTVRATASDGRTAQSATYRVTDPCLRPG